MASLERFAAACFRSGERCALACASLAYGGSLAYGARGGAALCEASKEPPKEAAPPEPEHGGERYLAYSASLARLKVVLLKTKLALAKTTMAKGAALKTAAAGKAAAVKTAAAEGARYVAYSSDVGESMRPVLKPWMVTARAGAKFPTSKAPISAVFHSFRLIFGRAIIDRSALEAWMLFLERAQTEHSR